MIRCKFQEAKRRISSIIIGFNQQNMLPHPVKVRDLQYIKDPLSYVSDFLRKNTT
jgi:hypothetical protein